MGYTVLLSFEWKHVINDSKMEQEQHKTMKNDCMIGREGILWNVERCDACAWV